MNSMSGCASKKRYAGRIEGSEAYKIGFLVFVFSHGGGGNEFQFSQEIWWLRILLNCFVIHHHHHHHPYIYIYNSIHIYIYIIHHHVYPVFLTKLRPFPKAALRRELRFRRLVTRPTRLGDSLHHPMKGIKILKGTYIKIPKPSTGFPN